MNPIYIHTKGNKTVVKALVLLAKLNGISVDRNIEGENMEDPERDLGILVLRDQQLSWQDTLNTTKTYPFTTNLFDIIEAFTRKVKVVIFNNRQITITPNGAELSCGEKISREDLDRIFAAYQEVKS